MTVPKIHVNTRTEWNTIGTYERNYNDGKSVPHVIQQKERVSYNYKTGRVLGRERLEEYRRQPIARLPTNDD